MSNHPHIAVPHIGSHFINVLELVQRFNPNEYTLYLESDTHLCAPLTGLLSFAAQAYC